jgi:EmrB/QacA subfamily drug resistance transporter
VEALDIAIINLAVPSIQKAFVLSSDKVQWLQTLYVLFYGGFLLIGGKLSDVFGRKKIFITGCTLFLFTSLGAGLSNSYAMLLAFRAIQGLAAAFVMPSAFSIVTHYFTDTHERGKAIGIFSSFAAIGSGGGLSIGGLIASYWGWQWVFFINVPALAIIIVLAFFLLEKESPQPVKSPDLLSGILLVVALVSLSLLIHLAESFTQNIWQILALAAFFALCIRVLYARLTQQQEPLIDLALLRVPSLLTGSAVFILLGAFFTSYLFLISLILQHDMHFSAVKAGFMLVPFSLLSAVFARLFLPGIMKKLNISGTAVLGMATMLAGGLVLLAAVNAGNIVLLMVAAGLIAGFGITICFTSFSVMSMQQVPARHNGVGSSLTTTAYFFGGGIGLSFVTVFMGADATGNVVGIIPVIVLCLFALTGIVVLTVYTRKTGLNVVTA